MRFPRRTVAYYTPRKYTILRISPVILRAKTPQTRKSEKTNAGMHPWTTMWRCWKRGEARVLVQHPWEIRVRGVGGRHQTGPIQATQACVATGPEKHPESTGCRRPNHPI